MSRLRAGATAPPSGGRRGMSLHVAVNAVDAGAYPIPVPVLRACENDGRAMEAVAKAQGFVPRRLFGSQATAANVLAAITDAAKTLRSGDFFFLTWAGHGAQVPDLDGDDEDGLDETWVLYDRQLPDDELRARLNTFQPGVRIFVMSDSCHSGTVTRRFDGDEALRSALADVAPRVARAFYGAQPGDARTKRLVSIALSAAAAWGRDMEGRQMLLPRRLSHVDAGEDFLTRQAMYRDAHRSPGETKATVLLFAACQDNQVALDGRENGKFTEEFLAVWRSGVPASYGRLHSEVLASMPENQTPNLDRDSAASVKFAEERPLTIAGGSS